MKNNNYIGLTEKNLDLLAEFLTSELEDPTLTAQIPNESHIFHGTYNDAALTQANVELAARVLLGMALGYVEDAPLVMVFESKPGERIVVDRLEVIEQRQIELANAGVATPPGKNPL
jgi:hypothetical protein